MQHPELGRRILDNIADEADDISKIEVYPKLDGRNMVMVLVPDKEKQAALAAEEAAAAAAEAAAAEAPPAQDTAQPEPAAPEPAEVEAAE